MGNRSWRAWSLPQVPQGVRKGLTEHGGSYMLVVWGNKTGEARILLPTPNKGWVMG